mmetsp:Transcript_74893/g.134887  ORF Transcript_74893/g.134887 Transcript_74893/m.134887 type:complete len:99 (-) Transcript_74893:17-313(-)
MLKCWFQQDSITWPWATRIGLSSMNTDVFILRATEILFEEWKALGSRGIATPAIAVWPVSPKLPAGSNSTWQWLLDKLYNILLHEELVNKQGWQEGRF